MSEHGKDVLAWWIFGLFIAGLLVGMTVGLSISTGVWYAGPSTLAGLGALVALAWAIVRIERML